MPRPSRPSSKARPPGRRGTPARTEAPPPPRKQKPRRASAPKTRTPHAKAKPLRRKASRGAKTREVQEVQEDFKGPWYLHGVVRAKGPLKLGALGLGMPPARIHGVREGALTALVSPIATHRVDPTRANLMAHQRAAEVILREHTLLPVAFGTVLSSRTQVQQLLRATKGVLTTALSSLDGKVELGVKVLHHREHLARRMELEDLSLRRRADEMEAEHERRLWHAVELRAALDMAAMLESLRPLAAASRIHSPVGERMLLNTAFLVTRAEVPAFEAKVRTLAARSDLYSFRFTGPWPAYSFVDVRFGLDGGKAPAASRSAG
ncbi:GvpL/GvpF family gas vesicle protein [Myxococcus landrumensis]|uniref:GvpL/GvpF family gas vesicle protein n=1 Tax=Myxococcus landrumensis TaxID=2813577 RepID=A0ABX7NG69_9BACT|nr:GvpL/GvpF family gas vesicle protein [Myxococcus landrumus]QSQ17817.1 GvpL/GvpF family gas vesicle protein [Myxococcus landrumus]